MVQISHPYMTTGKIIALTRWTYVSRVVSLLFNMLSVDQSFSSKEQMSFNFMAAVTICSDFGAHQNKVSHCFCCFPISLPWNAPISLLLLLLFLNAIVPLDILLKFFESITNPSSFLMPLARSFHMCLYNSVYFCHGAFPCKTVLPLSPG